ncbi:hypothetical protein PIB30_106474, partial [Stylosanthes scabra]|nr:hypothetical protein [Stylosanthes scabra]
TLIPSLRKEEMYGGMLSTRKSPTTEQATSCGQNKRVVDPNLSPLPFPAVAKKTWKDKSTDPRIIELLKKVEVTLPLFELIQQIPKYAKEICIHKNKIKELGITKADKSISAMRHFPDLAL